MDEPVTTVDIAGANESEGKGVLVDVAEVLLEEVLVEEVSIDGMCGVY